MHLVETYALACGAKIDIPYIYEKYFPVPDKAYVTFQPFSQGSIKNYDHWPQVIELIYPVFEKKEISIIQIGAKDEKPFKGCSVISGQTNINQVAYVIKRGEMHFGTDSFGVHLASAYKKKILALYSNNIIKNVGPYWSGAEDVILLEPDRKGKKPNYSLEERPKSINTIKPEDIAESICSLFGLDFKKPYETIYIGERHGDKPSLVFVPDSLHFIKAEEGTIMELRMDYHFDLENLEKQLQICKCSIVTDKAIHLNILKTYRPNIAHLIYKVTKNDDPEFIRAARKLGINIMLVSKLSEKEIKDKKIDYYDVGRINAIEETEKELVNKIKNSEDLLYKSNKVIMSDQQTYSSYPKYVKKTPSMGNFESTEKTEDFFDDLDHFHIVKKLD
jgi:hypothetical protein